MISAGQLTERVRIYRMVKTEGMFGEQVKNWEFSRSVWANVKFNKGMRALNQGEEWMTGQIVVTIHDQPGIDDQCKLEWNGKKYIIDSLNRARTEASITIVAVKEDEGTGE